MASVQSGHPLPAPPGQPQQYVQQRPEARPRSKSSFSLHSTKTHNSSGSGGKINLHETHAEKESRRLTSKADPLLAMNELEPSAVARGAITTAAPLRAIQHRDANGNPIADPDRSNPTRSRWERPLDTIRAFEAAIDGNYSRKSYMRTESADAMSTMGGRRTSYYGAQSNVGGGSNRYPRDSYYGGAPNSYRPDSYVDRANPMSRPDSYYDNQGGPSGPSNGYYPSRARYPRTASEPQFNHGGGIYPVPGNQQSYETVTTASGSGSSGEAHGYSTDPSSENSSIDRIAPKPEQTESYGFNGFGGAPDVQMPINEYGSYGRQQPGPQMSGAYQRQTGGPPPVPRKQSQGPPRVPIKLGAGGESYNEKGARPDVGEKRKSWFGKRFSRS